MTIKNFQKSSEEDVLYGDKIILRPMNERDTDFIINWRNQTFVKECFIYRKPFTKQGHLEWIETMIRTGKAVQYIICEKKDMRPVGTTYLRDISDEYHKAEFGIFIGEKEAHGKGYGTEAAKLLTNYAFKKLKLHKIMVRIISDNVSSIKSHEKAGFVQEAYLKDEVVINEEYKDIIFMAMFHNE